MTKKGIIASVFAVVCAVCLIIVACIFGLKSNSATNPAPVNSVEENSVADNGAVKAQGEKQTKDQSTDDTNTSNTDEQSAQNQQQSGDEVESTENTTPVVTSDEGDSESTTPADTTGDDAGQSTDSTDTPGETTGDGEGQSTDPTDTPSEPETTDPATDDPTVVVEPVAQDILGDVNIDGEVNFCDWLTLNSIFKDPTSATEQQLMNADVNADGLVTPLDLKLLKLGVDGVITLPSNIKAQGGDLNGDGLVRYDDVMFWNNNIDSFNQLPQNVKVKFDLDNNGEVNSVDYAILREMVDTGTTADECLVYFVENLFGSKNIQLAAVKIGCLANEFLPSCSDNVAFLGWYTDAKCTTKFDFSKPIVTDTVLYGKWTQVYHVTYMVNGEKAYRTGVMAGEVVTDVFTPEIPEGYDFDGWFVDDKFVNKFDFNTPLTQNFVLYAKFTKVFTVSYVDVFYTHDGETMASEQSTQESKVRDGELAENLVLPTRRIMNNYGYAEFAGWSTTPIEIEWTPDMRNADKIARGDVKVKLFDFTKPITENVTVYAKWLYTYVNVNEMTLDDIVDAIDKNATTSISVEDFYAFDLNKDSKLNGADIAIWTNKHNGVASIISGSNTSADVNRDGVVNDADVVETAHKLVAGENGVADVNGDLVVTINDVATVAKTAGYDIEAASHPTPNLGDLNLDGEVNGIDSVVFSKYLKRELGLTDQGLENADVNADGVVNDYDEQVLAMFLRGYISSLPHSFKGDVADVNGDGLVNASDTAAWNAIFEDYKRVIAEMEQRLDINLDGKINDEDLERIEQYFNLQYIKLFDCTVSYKGVVFSLGDLMYNVFNKEKATNFRVTITVDGEEYVNNASISALEKMTFDLSKYKNGSTVEIKYVYDQGWTGSFWGQFNSSFGYDNQRIDQTCTLIK